MIATAVRLRCCRQRHWPGFVGGMTGCGGKLWSGETRPWVMVAIWLLCAGAVWLGCVGWSELETPADRTTVFPCHTVQLPHRIAQPSISQVSINVGAVH